MTSSLKIIFDNTSSPRLARDLAGFYDYDFPNLEVVHLRDKFKPNAKDPEWLESIRSEGGWIVISGDRGKMCAVDRLPIICQALKITHVLTSATIQSNGYPATKQAIASTWREIVALASYPAGTKGVLRYHSDRNQKVRPVLFVDGAPLLRIPPPSSGGNTGELFGNS